VIEIFRMAQILKTMTIQEAAALWNDPLLVHLSKWEREFNQPLEDLHSGHCGQASQGEPGQVE
jgi:hypothetical protein